MDAPSPGSAKKIAFKNNQGQKIEVNMEIKDSNLCFKSEISENALAKKRYESKYSLEAIKENNKFFFLCQYITDVYKQIEILSNDKSNFIIEQNKMILHIPTNMPLAPEIVIELNEIEKNINTKVEELNDYIIKKEKQNDSKLDLLIKENKELKDLLSNLINNKFDVLIKENKEMKEKIINLENLLNTHLGILPDAYFEMIKNWIGGDKNKIFFHLIYNLRDDKDYNRFHKECNVSKPVVFIFITTKKSIFGAYCPCFNTSGGQWINDSNAFIFSINLNKKYPAKNSSSNYYRGVCGFHFQDITYCDFSSRKGSLGTGYYLNTLELEGDQKEFNISHFYAYQVDK